MIKLLSITKSRLRQKIISYFFTNPNTHLYLREAAAILKDDPGNLSKEFVRLEKEGIFISERRGNQKYLYLNKDYALYQELKSIVFKTTGVEGSLREIIGRTEGVNFSFIYGSFAADRQNAASDIDLLIVGNPDEEKLLRDIESIEKILNREINYNIYPLKEFRKKVKRRDSFIKNILKRPKIILRGEIGEI